MSASSTTEIKPKVYLFFGDDGYGMSKIVQEMLARYDDPTLADLNLNRLAGRTSIDEIRSAAYTLPFLAERRTVIVEAAQDYLKQEKDTAACLRLLESLPESTALILLVHSELDRKDWKDFKQSHWLRKWSAAQPAGVVFVREFALPAPAQMRTWIIEETRRQNGQIVPVAAVELADLVGTNTQMASQEINKLLTYVDFARTIELDDVKELVADVAPSSIFSMVDALAEGQKQTAIQLLHELMSQDDPYRVFGMIIRQFRLLLQTRELLDNGYRSSELATALKLHPFVAEKLEKQARHFPMTQLKNTYQRLLNMDENNKKSLVDLSLDLDLFVSELTLV